ncbi:MAG: histidine phosphatase family protein [Flavihumibacter sp.]
MKTIYLVRHAKSSWGDLTVSDFDRPLSDRGQRNAPEMAQRLALRGITIDRFISSSAKRAMQTAFYFMEAFERNPEEIVLRDDMYHAMPEVYYSVLEGLDDRLRSVALFGHNPGITLLVNELTGARVDDMPTCGVFACTLESGHWKHIRRSAKNFLFFEAP